MTKEEFEKRWNSLNGTGPFAEVRTPEHMTLEDWAGSDYLRYRDRGTRSLKQTEQDIFLAIYELEEGAEQAYEL